MGEGKAHNAVARAAARGHRRSVAIQHQEAQEGGQPVQATNGETPSGQPGQVHTRAGGLVRPGVLDAPRVHTERVVVPGAVFVAIVVAARVRGDGGGGRRRCGYFLAPALVKMWSKGGDRAENDSFAHNRHHPHQTQQTTCPVVDLVCCPGFALWGQPRRMQR
eukprot:gene2859-biopygen8092